MRRNGQPSTGGLRMAAHSVEAGINCWHDLLQGGANANHRLIIDTGNDRTTIHAQDFVIEICPVKI